MNIIAYYHVLTINNWEEIVEEQLQLIEESGLYDKLRYIKIVCLGKHKDELLEIIEYLPKAKIVYHSEKVDEYEFPTLKILQHDALEYHNDFVGLYFHTKAVSFPKHNGGKYWRNYMNHYNITMWRSCIHELKTYDLCGVKLIVGKKNTHYSGNFFWFNSDYIRDLKCVDKLDKKDRFNAEYWVCSGDGDFACLSNEFVDYHTKGTFRPPINYVHTLAYNLVSEVEKATKSLYELNSNFHHVIVDLGFPLEKDRIPDNINKAKKRNSARLRRLARKYGSEYVKIPNVGVSQNWTAVYEHLDMKPDDVLIGADPDERPQQENWVSAMATILRHPEKIGMVSLTMPKQKFGYKTEVWSNSILGVIPVGLTQWALIGFRGDFLDTMGGVPVPYGASRYGWIEQAVHARFGKFQWCMLPDYTVVHTDYELGDKGTSRLLREWKNTIIFEIKKYGQIGFDEFLERKRNGEFNIKDPIR